MVASPAFLSLVFFFTSAHISNTATPKPGTTAATSLCPNCVTNKKGKASCCTKGASWYQNCGDIGDANFDYTWNQGFEACEHVGSDGEPQSQTKIPPQTIIVQQQNDVQQQMMDSTDDTKSKYKNLWNPIIFTTFLFITSYTQF